MDAEPFASAVRRPRPLAALRNFAVFALALAGGSMLLAALTPFPKAGTLTRKWEHLRANTARYSLVFVGSSRVNHEFIPAQFDAALAARGHAMASFNFGQNGMWPPESLYMAREILALRPPNLRWVLIDVTGIKPVLDGNEESQRAVHWHDWRHTRMACRYYWETDLAGQRTTGEKISRIRQQWSLWAQRTTALGRGHEAMEIAMGLQRERKGTPIEDEGFERGKDGPLTGADLALFEREVARLRKNPAPKPIPPVLRDALEGIAADVRAAGAEPVFVVAAWIFGTERFSDWPPPGVRVLAFDDPAKFPQLYDPARRFDPHHLDLRGAEEFTRLLAERFAAMLEEKK